MVSKKLEFKAGLMNMDSETNLVKADRRPGKLTVEHVGVCNYQNTQGEKIFTWRPLDKTAAELEVYVFEGDAKFRPVKGTKGGRK